VFNQPETKVLVNDMNRSKGDKNILKILNVKLEVRLIVYSEFTIHSFKNSNTTLLELEIRGGG
jgi:hypothetical protein